MSDQREDFYNAMRSDPQMDPEKNWPENKLARLTVEVKELRQFRDTVNNVLTTACPAEAWGEPLDQVLTQLVDRLTKAEYELLQRDAIFLPAKDQEIDILRAAIRAMWPLFASGLAYHEHGGMRSLQALRANAEAAQHIDRQVMDEIIRVVEK